VIAELADQNTIGILTQDSDFLIYQYPEHVKYLSILNFNFSALFEDAKTLKTVCYDRVAFVKHLNSAAARFGGIRNPQFPQLEIGHLPLWATLKGNDLIPCKDLQQFHNWILGNILSLVYFSLLGLLNLKKW
jgi:hypothetical protein